MSAANDIAKTSATQLVEDTAESFHTYIGKGVSVPGIGDVKTDPNLNVNDLNSLLRVHFVVTGTHEDSTSEQSSPSVIPFMHSLPDRIRRLKRSTYREPELVTGGVDGDIDWGETVAMYSRRGFVDRTKFVCSQHRTEYNTAENQVVKRLLVELQSVFENELEATRNDPESYRWLEPWLSRPGFLDTLSRTLEQNVYLQEVDPPKRIPARALRKVKHSRRPLYREAGELLEYYYSLRDRNFSEDQASEILQNVYVRPKTDDGGRLFELYWLFELLKQFPDNELNIIRSGTNRVATWAYDDKSFELFHHSAGPNAVSFRVRTSGVARELAVLEDEFSSMGYLQRAHAVQRDSRAIAKKALDSDIQQTLYAGIPDMLLVRTNPDGDVTGIMVGEVKYTRDVGYIKTGIEELMEYLYYLQCGRDYVVNPASCENDIDSTLPVEGALFVDKLPAGVDDSDLPISIVEYGNNFAPSMST